MGLKEASIALDSPWGAYYAGQAVGGSIQYVFDAPKKVRGIYVKFKGEAQTSWNEKTSQRDAQGQSREIVMAHTGNEEYWSIMYYLIGSKNGNEIEIPAGTHSYNFTATLPPSLPSSFEGEYGYVRYTVKVTLDRPMKFDQETKMAFTVINPLDLNLNPSYREPIRMQMEKTFCCLCCKSAPLSVDIRAPVSGYVPGQAIPIELNVENQSNVQLHLVKISLRKIVRFRATTPQQATKISKVVIAEVTEGPVPAGATKAWTLKLDIPPIPPSNLVGCSLIDLDYDFKAECKVSGVHMNLSDKKTITIGTVPLVGLQVPAAKPQNPSQPVPGAPQNPGVAPYNGGQVIPNSGLPVGPLPTGPGFQPPVPTGPGFQPPVPTGPGYQPPFPSAPYITDPNNPGAPGPAGDAGGGGWSGQPPSGPQAPPPHQSLYPSLSSPIYQESQFNARNIQDATDNQYVKIEGRQDFAPRYPTYNMPLPQ